MKDDLGELSGRRRPAGFRYPEPPRLDAVDFFDARLVVVRPCAIVARARRQHLDVGMLGKMFGDVAGVKFGAAVYRQAVALNDDGQLHCGSGSKPASPLSDTSFPCGSSDGPPSICAS